MKDGKATGEYEDFLVGFVTQDGDVWGRPVGVAVGQGRLADGHRRRLGHGLARRVRRAGSDRTVSDTTLPESRRRAGFTLIELLVVIAIIARPDRPAPAGRAGGPRGGPARPVRQQPEADRPRPAQLPRRARQLPGRLPLSERARPVRRPRRCSTAGRPWRRWPRTWSRRTSTTPSISTSRWPTSRPGGPRRSGRSTRPTPPRWRPGSSIFLCPSDGAPPPADGLGADELRLLLRRRLGRRRRDQAPTARSSSGPAMSLARPDRRIERHRGGLGAAARDRRPLQPDDARRRSPRRRAGPSPGSPRAP